MFDALSGKLQQAFRNLRGLGKLSEANVAEALREVRMALLEADVNFKVARDFIERVKTQSLGTEVVRSIQPGQQIVKIIHDEMVNLLGDLWQPDWRVLLSEPNVKLHLYGKKEARPGRKMGHYNVLDSDLGRALETANRIFSMLSGDQNRKRSANE